LRERRGTVREGRVVVLVIGQTLRVPIAGSLWEEVNRERHY